MHTHTHTQEFKNWVGKRKSCHLWVNSLCVMWGLFKYIYFLIYTFLTCFYTNFAKPYVLFFLFLFYIKFDSCFGLYIWFILLPTTSLPDQGAHFGNFWASNLRYRFASHITFCNKTDKDNWLDLSYSVPEAWLSWLFCLLFDLHRPVSSCNYCRGCSFTVNTRA